MEMNLCIQEEYKKSDKELNASYQKLKNKLTDSSYLKNHS